MGLRVVFATLAFWVVTAAEAFAQGFGGPPVPEIDGPAGIAALAILTSVGLIVYNRFRK